MCRRVDRLHKTKNTWFPAPPFYEALRTMSPLPHSELKRRPTYIHSARRLVGYTWSNAREKTSKTACKVNSPAHVRGRLFVEVSDISQLSPTLSTHGKPCRRGTSEALLAGRGVRRRQGIGTHQLGGRLRTRGTARLRDGSQTLTSTAQEESSDAQPARRVRVRIPAGAAAPARAKGRLAEGFAGRRPPCSCRLPKGVQQDWYETQPPYSTAWYGVSKIAVILSGCSGKLVGYEITYLFFYVFERPHKLFEFWEEGMKGVDWVQLTLRVSAGANLLVLFPLEIS